MELTDLQKAKVKQWVSEGVSLSDIQKILRQNLIQKLTFMDVRFLVLDLDVEIKRPQKKQETSGKSGTATGSNHTSS